MKSITILILFMLCFSSVVAQHDYVLVFFTNVKKTANRQELRTIFDRHLKFIDSLKSNSMLKAYGTFEKGESIAVFRNSDIRAVENLVMNNPLITLNIFRAEYFHTNLRFGGFCPATDEELVRYNFVRYTSHITKFNVQHVPQLLKMHDDYLNKITATGNVLVEGVFSNSDGGFMIIQGDLAKEVIISDPTYQAGFTIPEINDVFFAEGALCED